MVDMTQVPQLLRRVRVRAADGKLFIPTALQGCEFFRARRSDKNAGLIVVVEAAVKHIYHRKIGMKSAWSKWDSTTGSLATFFERAVKQGKPYTEIRRMYPEAR